MNFRVVIFAQAGKSAAFLGKDGCPEPGGSGGQLIEQLPQPVHGEQREHGGFRGMGITPPSWPSHTSTTASSPPFTSPASRPPAVFTWDRMGRWKARSRAWLTRNQTSRMVKKLPPNSRARAIALDR